MNDVNKIARDNKKEIKNYKIVTMESYTVFDLKSSIFLYFLCWDEKKRKKERFREKIKSFSPSCRKAAYDARILKSMRDDAIMKAAASLPAKVQLADTAINATVGRAFENQTILVPSAAMTTKVHSMAGPDNEKQVNDWRWLYTLYGGKPTQYQKIQEPS